MNNVSGFWTKQVEVTAQAGEVVLVRCEGFTFKSDREEKTKNEGYSVTGE
jgi:hypothetical protein